MGDFDFLVGRWTVANRKLVKRLAGCTEWAEFTSTSRCWNLFDGAANLDEFEFPDGSRGLTLRLLDRATGQWSLNWSSSETGTLLPPVLGRFEGGVGRFFGDDEWAGTPVRVRYVWSDTTPESARWEQAFSADGEQTWELNWVMEFSRLSSSPDSHGAGEAVG